MLPHQLQQVIHRQLMPYRQVAGDQRDAAEAKMHHQAHLGVG